MTRLGTVLCRVNSHAFTERDEFGRTSCERCGVREPVRYRILNDIEQQGREMIRPKTKGAKR